MKIITLEFTLSHGKQPKGFGGWAFRINGETKFFSGNYADAKRAAVEYAKMVGATSVTVLP
jgi:hypothetical protein